MGKLYAYDRDMRELEKRLAKQEQLVADVCLDIVAHQQHHRGTVEANIQRHEEKIAQLEGVLHEMKDQTKPVKGAGEGFTWLEHRKLSLDAMYKPDEVSLSAEAIYEHLSKSDELDRIRQMLGSNDKPNAVWEDVREQSALLNEVIEQRNLAVEERDDAVNERDAAHNQLRQATKERKAVQSDLSHLREQLTQILSGQDNCSDYDLLAMVQNALNYVHDLRKRLLREQSEHVAQRNRVEQFKTRNKRLMAKLRDCRVRMHEAENMSHHPDDVAVDKFSQALKAKMKEGRDKGRYGWDDAEDCPADYLGHLFVDHLFKTNEGNFEDLGCILMMLHQRGEPVTLIRKQMKQRGGGWMRVGAARMAENLLRVVRDTHESHTKGHLIRQMRDTRRMVLNDISMGEERGQDR